jgi:hypothetical protein
MPTGFLGPVKNQCIQISNVNKVIVSFNERVTYCVQLPQKELLIIQSNRGRVTWNVPMKIFQSGQ